MDVDDSLLTGREVTTAFTGIGLPNFDQATRMLQLQLSSRLTEMCSWNFRRRLKGVGIAPGDLITVTYLKEGLERQPFRVVQLAPGQNYQSVQVTAQWHDDDWYTTGGAGTAGGSRAGRRGGGVAEAAGGKRARFATGSSSSESRRADTPTAGGGFTVDADGGFRPAREAARLGREYSFAEFESGGERDGRNDRGRADAVLRGERAGWERGGKRIVLRGSWR